MSLRPRYSLLTLLILTALVAGGVKLWYGPHHVVERTETYVEDDYTFTRDLFGNKTIQGVRIKRYEQPLGTPEHVLLEYYREGTELNRLTYILIDTKAKIYSHVCADYAEEGLDFTVHEQAEIDRVAEGECKRLLALGFTLDKGKNPN